MLTAVRDPEFVTWARGAGVRPDLISITGEDIKGRKASDYNLYTKYKDALAKAAG